MTTSLAKQLQSLQTPQTGQSSVTRKVFSILFDKHTAEELTIDKAFQLGVQGIRDLQVLNPRFKEFEELLFKESSKTIQRAVQNSDFNERLDLQINKFLVMVSPHLLLKPALQALEWLVHRFQIGEYNTNELIMCALPFHNTPTFCLVLRAIPEIRKENSPWHWLKPVLDSGVPVAVLTIHKTIGNQIFLLRMIIQHTVTAYKDCVPGDYSRLQMLFSFTTSLILGVLVQKNQKLGHTELSCIVPLIHTGLASTSAALLASSLAIVSHLASTLPLAESLGQEIITHLTLVKLSSMLPEAISVLVLFFSAQTRILGKPPKLSVFAVTKLAAMETFPEIISQIQSRNQTLNLTTFLMPLFESALEDCVKDGQFASKGVDKMIIKLFECLMLPTDQAATVIKFFLKQLPDNLGPSEASWFSSLFRMLESRYPSVLDSQTRKVFALNTTLKDSYHVILTHQGLEAEDGVMTVQGLCHQMVHPEESVRASAVRTAGKMLKTMPEEDKPMLQSCLRDRLKDESMAVVCAVLTLKHFSKIISAKESQLDVMLELLEHAQHNKWNAKALAYLLAHVGNSFADELTIEKELLAVLHVLPHIIVNPATFSVFAETKICTKSPLLQELYKKVASVSSKKALESVVLLSAVQDVLKGCKPTALGVVQSRLENMQLSSLDYFLLCSILQGISAQVISANHRMKCCTLAMAIKKRAKICFPKKPLYPPLSKAQMLTGHYNDLVKNDVLPIDAFTEIISALVKKPMKPFMSDVVGGIHTEVGSLIEEPAKKKTHTDKHNAVDSVASKEEFHWKRLIEGENDRSEEELFLKLSFTVMAILLELYPKFEQVDEEQPHMFALRTFMMMNFDNLEDQLHFLALMWSQPELQMEERLRAVMFATSILKMHPKSVTDILKLNSENCFVPALLCTLSNPEPYMRQVAVKLLAEVSLMKPREPNNSYLLLITNLVKQSDEISQNGEHLSVALFSLLTDDATIQTSIAKNEKKLMDKTRKCLFAHVVSTLTPRLVTAALLKSLVYIKDLDCLNAMVPLAEELVNNASSEDGLEKHGFEILSLILERIDGKTAQKFLSSENGWKCFQTALSSKLAFHVQSLSKSAVAIVTKEMYNSLTPELKAKLVHLLLTTDDEKANLKAFVSSTLRKLPLSGELVSNELKKMVHGSAPKKPTVEKRATRSGAVSTAAAAAKVTSALGWSQGTILLEALPEKKKMEEAHLIVPVLFDILKICLESDDDQEYVKQLTLSSLNSLLTLCQSKGVSCTVDIELIVNSLKTTVNPRTQRETLILLCHTAQLVPNNLIHHLVSVFTFMGTLVLRHDDEYSLQIITQVIEDVVPVIIKSNGKMAGLTNILRVFSDALPDIPSHRRQLIFEHLMAVVGWEHLWLLLVLVFESEAYCSQQTKPNPRFESVLEMIKTCKMPVLLEMLHRVFLYLTLFTDIEYGAEKQVSNAVEIKMKIRKLTNAELIDPCSKSASDVRKFQLVSLDFLSKLLSIKPSDNEGFQPTEKLNSKLEKLYKQLMDCLMSYLLVLSQKEAKHKSHSKFWSLLLLQGYSVLNKINMLLPLAQFVSVVQGVLTNPRVLDSVKSKTLELLGAKLQLLSKASESDIQELIPLLSVCKTLAMEGESGNACKALFCLRLLIGLLGSEGLKAHHELLKTLLDQLLKLTEKLLLESNHSMMANTLLCLAELATVLKMKMLGTLQALVPTVLTASSNARKEGAERSEIVMLASLALVQRLLENLPQFLSSFLQSILEDVSQIASLGADELSVKAHTSLQYRVKKIQELLSSSITLRVLITPIHDAFKKLSEQPETLASVGPLMNVLKARFDNMQSSEVPVFVPELTVFFLDVLKLRSNWAAEGKEAEAAMSLAEQEVISALVTFVLKLQEPVFKPFFYKLYKWSKDAEEDSKERAKCITFFRVVTSFAEKLKGLFTIFVPIYVKQAASMLQTCHSNSSEKFFDLDEDDTQALVLLEWVLQSFVQVFTHDRQRFVKQDTFDLLMQPLVDQLENLQGGEEAMLERGRKLVGPCLAQFARCMEDDVLWKQLHYQILLKTRSNHPKVRLVTIEAIQTLAEVLREDLLPLLPEAIPFIAELMEDEDPEVEKKTQHVSRELEKILGEPLDKYF